MKRRLVSKQETRGCDGIAVRRRHQKLPPGFAWGRGGRDVTHTLAKHLPALGPEKRRVGIYLESANFRSRGRFDYCYSPPLTYAHYKSVELAAITGSLPLKSLAPYHTPITLHFTTPHKVILA